MPQGAMPQGREEADVVVVGARVAGSPAATELARHGRKVIVLDAGTFPSDTLSTHVIFPTCVAELNALGALEPLLATGSPKEPYVQINHGGVDVHWTYTAVDGFDYGMCPRRTVLDNILVETARKAGAEIREATKITGVEWRGGRVSAVTWADRSGNSGTIETKLLIGADGRRSTVAELVGASKPYRRNENGRGLVFMYVDDPYPADSRERQTLFQWRVGDTLGMYFPTCDNGGLILLHAAPGQAVGLRPGHGPLERAGGAVSAALGPHRRRRPPDEVARPPTRSPTSGAPAARAGPSSATPATSRTRSSPRACATPSTTAAAWPHAAAALDNPTWLDRRLYEWELKRDRECIVSYHFALRLSLTHPVSPVELEMWKTLEPDYDLSRELGDTFARTQSAESLLSYPHLIHWTAKAFVNPAYPKAEVAKDVARELATKARLYRDLGRIARRKRVVGQSWDAWGGPMRVRPADAEATPGEYIPAAVPQRSDLLAEEGEVKTSTAKVKESVA